MPPQAGRTRSLNRHPFSMLLLNSTLGAPSVTEEIRDLAQKWYQKATVQAGVAGGVFVVVAALITGYASLSNRPKSNTPTDKTVYTLGSTDGGIGKYWQHLKYSFTREEYVHV